MLPHERLEVYRKALEFVGDASAPAVRWDKRHAVADPFGRASESLILNLAEGARLRPGRAKLRALDDALGSCLECAACLDIAGIKAFLEIGVMTNHKQRPCQIARMRVGLAKAWRAWRLQEDAPLYEVRPLKDQDQPLFFHETLDVYCAGLDLAAAAAVKVAAGLDLAKRQGSWSSLPCEPGKSLLEPILAMLSRM
jgi:four helix bundle protein